MHLTRGNLVEIPTVRKTTLKIEVRSRIVMDIQSLKYGPLVQFYATTLPTLSLDLRVFNCCLATDDATDWKGCG